MTMTIGFIEKGDWSNSTSIFLVFDCERTKGAFNIGILQLHNILIKCIIFYNETYIIQFQSYKLTFFK